MDLQMVVERLNDLLELEMRGLPRRLSEVQSFVDPADTATRPAFERIVADEREHERRLAEEILRLGGVPRPTTPDMSSAHAHYLGARHLLPLLIEDKRQRIAAYERAAGDVSFDGGVAGTVGEILARHQAHLEQLETLAEQVASERTDRPAPAAQGDDT